MNVQLFDFSHSVREYDLSKAHDRFSSLFPAGKLNSHAIEPSTLRDLFLSRLDEVDLSGKYTSDLNLGRIIYYDTVSAGESVTYRIKGFDPFWRFLSLDILPDIVYKRHGARPEYFFSVRRRVYLKTLWWYFHLSDTGDPIQTLELLQSFSTDTIVQLVERSGKGYDVQLYRRIMSAFRDAFAGTHGMNDRFRSLMKLNTLYTTSMQPRCHTGGLNGYVHFLIDSVRDANIRTR